MRWMAPAVLTLLASVSAHAQTKPLPPASWPDKPTATLPRGEYVLTGDTTISYDSITFIDGTIITTSGYEFDLTINDELDIQGKLTIRSYAPTQVPTGASRDYRSGGQGHSPLPPRAGRPGRRP